MSLKKDFQEVVSGTITNIALAVVWGIFFFNSLYQYAATGEVILIAFCLFETLTLVFFLVRTRARKTSSSLFDWFSAIVGTFAGLFFVPGTATVFGFVGPLLFWVGITGEVLGLLSLNRSFAIVPSLRAIKTSGMYALVRHPLYLGHIVMYSGYLLRSISIWNCIVFLVFFVCMILRIRNEERYLSQDQDYRAYQSKVRWWLVPFVF